MKIIMIILALMFIPCASSERSYGNATVDAVSSVYDGDTFTVSLKENTWPSVIRNNISIRVNGIDCPEMKDDRDSVKTLAKKAREFTYSKLKSAKVVVLKDIMRDKYFRLDATVMIDGWSLGDSLVAKGLAHRYDGGTKTLW